MQAYTKVDTSTVRQHTFHAAAGLGGTPNPVPYDTTVGGTLYGFKNPHWRTSVRHHQNATTDLLATRYEAKSTYGIWRTTRTNKSTGLDDRWFYAAGGTYGGNVTLPALGVISSTEAANSAASNFYRDVRNKMSTFKGSVFAAEARDAKRMMVDRSKRILASIDPYQRRLKKRWYGKGSKRSRLKLLSDSWLELQFGWLPLFSDIQDAKRALDNPRPQYSRVKGESTSIVPVLQYTTPYNVGIGAAWVHYEEQTSVSVKYYGEIRAYKEPSGAGPLQDFGLHAREFLPTLWEVIPWSFAVDYFTNVGDIVTAISYARTDIRWSASLTRSYRVRKRRMEFEPWANTAAYSFRVDESSPFESMAKTSSVKRERGVQVDVPSFRWGLPNLKQGINLAALAVSRRLRLFHV